MFQAVYAPSRTPVVQTKVAVLNILDREYEQGDVIWYEVELFTACNATAEAVDLEIKQFLPDYFVYEEYDAVRYTNRRPNLNNSDPYVMLFTVSKIPVFETLFHSSMVFHGSCTSLSRSCNKILAKQAKFSSFPRNFCRNSRTYGSF